MGVTVIGGSAAAGGAAKTLGTHTLSNKVKGEAEKTVVVPSEFIREGVGITTIASGSYGHCWNEDGSRLYYHYGSDDIYYSTASTPYSAQGLGAATVARSNINTTNDGSPQFRGMTFNGDGTKIYIVNHDARNEIHVQDVATAYDLTSTWSNPVTYTLGTSLGITTPGDTASWLGNGGNILKFNDDGTKLFIKGSATNRIFEIPMTTGYDLSTAGTVVEHDLETILTGVDSNYELFDIDFTSDGKYVYCGSSDNTTDHKTIAILEMSTAYDLSTVSVVGNGSSLSQQDGIYVLLLDSDEDTMLTRGSNTTAHGEYPTNYKKHRGTNVTATLDISSGDTFVLKDATNFNRIDLQFSNAPADGTLKSFDVTVSNALDKLNLTDLKYSRRNGGGGITSLSSINADLNLPSTTGGSFLFAGKDINDIWIGEDTGNNRIWNWKFVYPELGDGNVKNYSNNLIGPEFVLNEYVLPYSNNSSWRSIGINPHSIVVYAHNDSLDSLASFYPGINPGDGGSLIHQVDVPSAADSATRYWISNDGKYIYEVQHDTDASIKNYQLTTPWDLSTLSSSAASTGTLPSNGDQTDGAVAVGFNGRFLFYKGASDKVYAQEMTTAHDLSTLNGNFNTEIGLDTNSQNLSVPTDNYGLTLPVGASNSLKFEQYVPTEINMYLDPPTSAGKPNGIDLTITSGTSKTFNFTTVDGGSNYYIKEV